MPTKLNWQPGFLDLLTALNGHTNTRLLQVKTRNLETTTGTTPLQTLAIDGHIQKSQREQIFNCLMNTNISAHCYTCVCTLDTGRTFWTVHYNKLSSS